MRTTRRCTLWLMLILTCAACAGGALGCWDKEIHEASFDRGPLPQKAQR